MVSLEIVVRRRYKKYHCSSMHHIYLEKQQEVLLSFNKELSHMPRYRHRDIPMEILKNRGFTEIPVYLDVFLPAAGKHLSRIHTIFP